MNEKFEFFNELNNLQKLLVLSSLGFNLKDKSSINKYGGAKMFLTPSLANYRLQELKRDKNLSHNFYLHMQKNFITIDSLGAKIIDTSLVKQFSNIMHLPLAMIYIGNIDLISMPILGVVGARNAQNKHLIFTENIAREFSQKGICIVSGGAIGVDLAAFKAAKDNYSIVVLPGTPYDIPKRIEDIFDKKRHLLLFPFGPWLTMQKYMFAARNEVIAALSNALVVAAGERGSGTRYTISFAKKLGKPIFAPSWDYDDPLSFITNEAIKKNLASIILPDYSNVTCLFNLPYKDKNINESSKLAQNYSNEPILCALEKDKNGLSIDELMLKSNILLPELQRKLSFFEIEGRIKRVGSKVFLVS